MVSTLQQGKPLTTLTDKPMNNTGCHALLRQLRADNLTCIFGNPGTSEQNLLDALHDEEFSDFTYYLALQEGAVVAMADAYARAARRPAIVQLHSYAGLANGLGMMKYAHRGGTPMVVIAGEAGLKYDALDGQMAGDLVRMAQPFVKSDHNGPCAWRIVDSGSLLRLLRRAIKTAATPPMGPVFLTLPMDVLDLPNNEEIVPSLLPVSSAVAPAQSVIREAAALLASAQNPLILMGDGIAASGAQDELVQAAELSGAKVLGANCSEVNMPASHPLFVGYGGHMFGEDSRRYTAEADIVLVCGTTVMPEVFPSLEGVFRPNASVIQFDLNVTEIAKNFPVTIGALADPKPTLQLLADSLQASMSPDQKQAAKERLERIKNEKAEQTKKQRDADQASKDKAPLQAWQFMEALGKRLPEGALVFDEALTHSPELLRYLPQDDIGSYFQTRAGMLGTGLPGTIGLKAAYPEKTVFGFSGDGGSMQTIQTLATAARYNLGAKFVVCNNRSYRILKYNLQAYWKNRNLPTNQTFPDAFDLAQPELNFAQLAQAQGVKAVRVTKADEIEKALDSALADDQPFLIELVLSSAL